MGGNGAADLIAAPIAGEHRHARVDIGRWTKDVDVVMAGEPKLLDPDVRDGLILKLAALVILDLPVGPGSPPEVPGEPYAFWRRRDRYPPQRPPTCGRGERRAVQSRLNGSA